MSSNIWFRYYLGQSGSSRSLPESYNVVSYQKETGGATHNLLDFHGDWSELEGMNLSGDTKPKVVFRLGHMGDVALITGVLSYWHETNGDTFIVITRAGNAPLLQNHPAVNTVIGLEDTHLKGKAWVAKARRLSKTYKSHTLIDLHGVLRSRILSLAWSGPVLRYPKFGLTRRLFDRTHADRYRRILEATTVPQRYAMAMKGKPPKATDLIPKIFLDDTERTAARVRLDSLTNGKPLVALHPYATHPAKQWPYEHWLGLTALLAGAGIDWFVVGRNNVPLFTNHNRDFTSTTTLRETCALMQQADLLVTADSGPMHLACGVDTPVLAMFGPTAKAWGFYPAGPKDRVLELPIDCRPCSLHGGKSCIKGYECLVGITPETVAEMIRDTFAS